MLEDHFSVLTELAVLVTYFTQPNQPPASKYFQKIISIVVNSASVFINTQTYQIKNFQFSIYVTERSPIC